MRRAIVIGALALFCLGCGEEGVDYLEPCDRGDGGRFSRGNCEDGLMCHGGICTAACERDEDCALLPHRTATCFSIERDMEGQLHNAYCVEGSFTSDSEG